MDNATPASGCEAATSETPSRKLRRIVVDLTPTLPGAENGGAKVMTLELISHLSWLAPNCDFILLTLERSHDELAVLDSNNVFRLCVSNAEDIARTADRLSTRMGSGPVEAAGCKVPDPEAASDLTSLSGNDFGNGLVRRLNADLLFCPFTALFYFDPSIPTVTVIYDLQHLYHPKFFEPVEIDRRDQTFRKACRLSSHIVCISDHVRQTVLENARIAPDKVTTVHILLSRRLPEVSPAAANRTLQSLQLQKGRYLLYPANFWPHKNHAALLTAFAIFRAANPKSDLKLVLTGAPGERRDDLIRATERVGFAASVTFLEYLDTEEFSAVLDSCLALIFPSLFEGFGMPLLEAMAARKPILCSNTTSLPEVAGGAAVLFDPKKPTEMAQAIAKLDRDPSFCLDLSERSAERLLAFGDAKDMAASYWKVFEAAVSRPNDLHQGVYGAFEDGWLGEYMMIVAGPGKAKRELVVRLALPGWAPHEAVTISWQEAGKAAEKSQLERGGTLTLRHAIDPSPRPVEVKCSPAFQPRAVGLGKDDRHLTCHCEMIEVLQSNGQSISLMQGLVDA